jgi:cysteine synthase
VNPYADFELPRIFRCSKNLHLAAFFLMKLLPARAIITRAIDEGVLKPGGSVIESTSGTFGLALAMLSRVYDFKAILVSDPVIDSLLKSKFVDLGVQLEIVHTKGEGGYQRARMARLREMMEQDPSIFYTGQYDNPDNAASYTAVADQLFERLGKIDMLVGSVGSGGSMSGTARRLREHCPTLEVIGVDTHNSILFGHPDGSRLLRGLGNSLMPKNVDHTQFDEVHWVSAAEGFLATRRLHQTTGLYQGPTSGAVWMVARWLSLQHPDKTIAALLPDDGTRYQHTVYDDDWLHAIPGWTGHLPDAPVTLQTPSPTPACWSRVVWGRKPLAQ